MTQPSSVPELPITPQTVISSAAVPNVYVPPAAPPPVAAEPGDYSAFVLSLTQLRAAVLAQAEETQESFDAVELLSKVDLHGAELEVGGFFPGTENDVQGNPNPPTLQQYIFAIFTGNQIDENESYLTGDLRVYTLPMQPQNPKAREWKRFTFNRATPSYTVARMTQTVFVEEVAGEWLGMLDLGDTDEEEPAK